MKDWILDTGPMVALLVSDDQFHSWAVEQVKSAHHPLYTCEAVISEACFLLYRDGYDAESLFALIDSGFLRCDFDFRREYRPVRDLMRRYREQPMSYADACLVRMAELRPAASIWTLDRHFQVYRQSDRQSLAVIAPW